MKNFVIILLFLVSVTCFADDVVTLTIIENNVEANFKIPEGQYMSIQEDFFYLKLKENPNYSLEITEYPIEDKVSKQATIKAILVPKSNITAGEVKLTFITGYQYCDENGACFFPNSEEITVIKSVESKNSLIVVNMLKFLLFALIGGLLLNIMPCVLPVLSIKALSLVKQREEDNKSLIKHGLLYSAGVITTMTSLALLVIILKISGEAVGWGFQFQNPSFTIILLSIIFLFGLSLFEIFFISLPGNISGKLFKKNKFTGSFFSGIFVVILATPCSAPFLGTALGFAFTQPPIIIFSIFLFIGVGLSIPFLILGFFPGFIKYIPKPGEWMNVFRVVMGFLLMGTSIWLLDVLAKQLSNMTPIYILLLTLAISAWIYGKFANTGASRKSVIIACTISIILLAGSSYNVIKSFQKNTEIEDSTHYNFSEAELNKHINNNKKVFVQFSAAWCMTCRVNDNAVLNTNEIQELFKSENVIILKGDFTNRNPELLSFMNKHGRAAVPFYAYFEGDNITVLPEIINKDIIYSLFDK